MIDAVLVGLPLQKIRLGKEFFRSPSFHPKACHKSP
ncbi:hypothetical protein M5D96_013154 [Drosophila gunungcola]|uniref:Uncharacterized protein n=1 Tax=Drosophila gunungcola TaxID=103775 RepID=A0A9Q0BJ48_9MUSC|nr:hypothetical protein M5D96_013154 [Drosophila gunungcola]